MPNLRTILCVTLVWVAPQMLRADRELTFNADIRPILSEYCFACHGPDADNRAADLRLDLREPALEYGAIVPGQADESLVVDRIVSDDQDMVMPPPEAHKSLNPEQIDTLTRWINEGAAYQDHWAFQPVPSHVRSPTSVSASAIDGSNKSRVDDHANAPDPFADDAIDSFIQRRWSNVRLEPTAAADRSTWLRRVCYDLTGLPPTTDQRERFLADQSPFAFERVVDHLLASPQHGEQMAVMWLDVARYADTFGYQNDIEMEVWPWRQWVVNAFNQNLPYDQFIKQQLAGDLLPGATDQTRIATAFNRLHRQTNEGGSVPEEFRLTGINDRTTTAATAFLGLTMECCRCHDHKFDPITQHEFYSLSAYFSDIDELGLYSHFTKATPTPAMLLYEDGQRESHQSAKEAVAAAEEKLAAEIESANRQWKPTSADQLPLPRPPIFSASLEGQVPGVVGNATTFTGDVALDLDEAPLFNRTSPFSYSFWVQTKSYAERSVVLHQSRAAEDAAFRGIEFLLDNGHPQFSMIHFWPGNAVRLRGKDKIALDQWTHIGVTHDGSGRSAGIKLFIDGHPIVVDVVRDQLSRDVVHRQEWHDKDVDKVSLALGARFRDIGFRDGTLDELNVFDVELSPGEIASIYQSIVDQSDDPHLKQSGDRFDIQTLCRHHDCTVADADVTLAKESLRLARQHENRVVGEVRELMVMRHDDRAAPTHILGRGEYTNKLQTVAPSPPTLGRTDVLTGPAIESGDRLGLANWMIDPQNPLPSRVMANRLWHLFFGRGIVSTVEDFGSQGSPPTHPKLLDYLASGLIENDWDLKWLCKQIVLSAAYRRSSKPTDASDYQNDPMNRWLARGPKHRLSAEQLRDTVLASSELLVHAIGGPSVKPYQPDGLWRSSGTGTTYLPSVGEGLYRRSMYTFWKRTAPPPTMLTLDATSRESCTPRRELTTTPLQALVFLNDPQYVEAARMLAMQLVANHTDLSGRWEELFLRLLSRRPSRTEEDIFAKLYHDQRTEFVDGQADASLFLQVGELTSTGVERTADLAATTVVVQMMFAYDETIMLR